MDDDGVIAKEDLPSTHMSARGDPRRGSRRAGAAAALEHRGEAAHSRTERGTGLVGVAGVPDAWHQQRPALYLAQAVPDGRADRLRAGGEAPVVGWPGPVPVRQASGAWSVRLAAGQGGFGLAHLRSGLDAA